MLDPHTKPPTVDHLINKSSRPSLYRRIRRITQIGCNSNLRCKIVLAMNEQLTDEAHTTLNQIVPARYHQRVINAVLEYREYLCWRRCIPSEPDMSPIDGT